MHLYLFRHGIAYDYAEDATDKNRTLTPEGVALLRRQAAVMARLSLRPDLLLTSDYLRALQTAALIGEVLGLQPQSETMLRPGCVLGNLERVLKREGLPASVMVIGHQPDLGEMARRITGGTVAVGKGTLVHVETHRARPGDGVMRAVIPADVMLSLGG
jgi:phosphohistidine phosphatase